MELIKNESIELDKLKEIEILSFSEEIFTLRKKVFMERKTLDSGRKKLELS